MDWSDFAVAAFKFRFGVDPTASAEDAQRERREAEFNRINDEIMEGAALAHGRAALQTRDQAFNEQDFLAGAIDTFLSAKKAAAKHNHSLIRSSMSEWCYQQWLLLPPPTGAVDRLTVARAAAVRVLASADGDSISVAIEAHTVSDEPVLREVWTFTRPAGQATQPGAVFGWKVSSIRPS